MKKDIHIPEVTDIEVAIVYEFNEIYKTDDWNVYIINFIRLKNQIKFS